VVEKGGIKVHFVSQTTRSGVLANKSYAFPDVCG